MFLSTILPLSVIGIGDIVILFVFVRAHIRRRQRGEKLRREESLPNLLLMLLVFNTGMVTAMLIS